MKSLPQHGAHRVRPARSGGRSDRLARRRPARRRRHGCRPPRPRRLVHEFAGEPGIARVQLWTAAARADAPDTAEMKSRGKDQLAAGRVRRRVPAPRRCRSRYGRTQTAAGGARHFGRGCPRHLHVVVHLPAGALSTGQSRSAQGHRRTGGAYLKDQLVSRTLPSAPARASRLLRLPPLAAPTTVLPRHEV